MSSKTFSTQETLANASAARAWLLRGLGLDEGDDQGAVARHFVAVSTQAERVRAFGIDPENMFGFWDWVGGRYSVRLRDRPEPDGGRRAGAVRGAAGRDARRRRAPADHAVRPEPAGAHGADLRVVREFFGAQSQAVLPYSQYLSRFPAYLQQLCMESNGKSVTRDGDPVHWQTGEVVWGEPGTNGQHAFYQLLHQGTRLVPADFIGFVEPVDDVDSMHALFTSNLLAQPRALAFGAPPRRSRPTAPRPEWCRTR